MNSPLVVPIDLRLKISLTVFPLRWPSMLPRDGSSLNQSESFDMIDFGSPPKLWSA